MKTTYSFRLLGLLIPAAMFGCSPPATNPDGKLPVVCTTSLIADAVKKIGEIHPDVQIFTVNVETEMNEQGYLVPGLGDAGDRLYQKTPSFDLGP